MSYTRAQKAPWPPVLRDSTTGNQETTLPRSESAGASYTPFARAVGNGSQLFRINIIHGIFVKNVFDSLREHPNSPCPESSQGYGEVLGETAPRLETKETVRKGHITHCLGGSEGPTGTEHRGWESHSQSPARWGQPCGFPPFENWSSGSSQTTLITQA